MKSKQWFWNLGIFTLVVAMLYLARDVFIPLALAMLFAFLLNPVVKRLERYRLGRIPSVLITFSVALLLIAALMVQVGSELTALVQDAPRYKTELVSKIKGLGGYGSSLGKSLEKLNQEVAEAFERNDSPPSNASSKPSKDGVDAIVASNESTANAPTSSESSTEQSTADQRSVTTPGTSPRAPLFVSEVKNVGLSWQSWAESIGVVAGPLGTASLVIVFTLFMMVYQNDLRDRLIKVVSGGQYVTTTRALNESAQRISSYLVAQAIVNASYGAVVAVGLWLIGLTFGNQSGFPNFLLWGFLCAILRFVPYIGPVFAAFFPLAIALTVFQGFGALIAVIALLVVVELVSNNIMEPWLYGSSTGLSAMAVIFAAVFWGWLWGPVGLLLATPLTVCLVVLGKHVESFGIFKTLLGEDEPLPIATRFYQRLLAGDRPQATAIAKLQLSDAGPMTLLDQTIVPTLRNIRRDRAADRLERIEEDQLSSSLGQVLSQILDEQSSGNTTAKRGVETVREVLDHNSKSSSSDSLLALPSHHAYEELLLRHVKDEFQRVCANVEVESTRMLPGALERKLRQQQPTVAVICALPPGGLLQTEFLCGQIAALSPHTKIVIAYLGKSKNFDRLLLRLRRAGASYVATSLEQTTKYVESIVSSSSRTIEEAVVPTPKLSRAAAIDDSEKRPLHSEAVE